MPILDQSIIEELLFQNETFQFSKLSLLKGAMDENRKTLEDNSLDNFVDFRKHEYLMWKLFIQGTIQHQKLHQSTWSLLDCQKSWTTKTYQYWGGFFVIDLIFYHTYPIDHSYCSFL